MFNPKGPQGQNPRTTCGPRTTVWETLVSTRQAPWHWGAFVQPLLQWKGTKYYIFWVCVCSYRYPACNAHAPYCHLWPVWLYNIFPHYLINGTIFGGKNVIEHKTCVLISSTNLVWNIFHSKKKRERCDQKCILVNFMFDWPCIFDK